MSLDPENTIVMETTKGKVVIKLRPDLAPGHVERIKLLAREGCNYYQGFLCSPAIDSMALQTLVSEQAEETPAE